MVFSSKVYLNTRLNNKFISNFFILISILIQICKSQCKSDHMGVRLPYPSSAGASTSGGPSTSGAMSTPQLAPQSDSRSVSSDHRGNPGIK